MISSRTRIRTSSSVGRSPFLFIHTNRAFRATLLKNQPAPQTEATNAKTPDNPLTSHHVISGRSRISRIAWTTLGALLPGFRYQTVNAYAEEVSNLLHRVDTRRRFCPAPNSSVSQANSLFQICDTDALFLHRDTILLSSRSPPPPVCFRYCIFCVPLILLH